MTYRKVNLDQFQKLFLAIMFLFGVLGLYIWSVYFALKGKHDKYNPDIVLGVQLFLAMILAAFLLYYILNLVFQSFTNEEVSRLEKELDKLKQNKN